MKHLHVFVWTLALTCLAMFPATVRADDDDLEGFDVTMEVLDDDADLDGVMAEMRGPESEESNDGTDGDDENDENDDADDGDVDDDLANEMDDDGDDGFDGESEFEEEGDLEDDGDFEDDEHVEDDVVEDGEDGMSADESGDGID